MFSVIIPCFNEEHYIESCLRTICEQTGLPDVHEIEIILVPNGCTDRTVQVCEHWLDALQATGFRTQLIVIDQPGKAQAINTAEKAACWGPRLFLDADVTLSKTVFAALLPLLRADEELFCSGTLRCDAGNSIMSRAYATVWCKLPFVAEGVPGVGLYGVSEPGRRRWEAFPDLHSDDRFVRLLFAPGERKKVADEYVWPVPQGILNLIRVRRRWCEGNLELFHWFPKMRQHDDKKTDKRSLVAAFFRKPLAFQVFFFVWSVSYALAHLKDPATPVAWRRGRP